MRGKKDRSQFSWLLLPVIGILVVLLLLGALSRVSDSQAEEGRRQMEESVRRAAVNCYAVEGIYPPNLEYLKEHYGLQVDESRYTVYYEVFADNLVPEITVVLR